MAGNTETIPTDVLWGGGQSPFSVTYGKMMMWFFLVSDALTFGGLLTAYGFALDSNFRSGTNKQFHKSEFCRVAYFMESA